MEPDLEQVRGDFNPFIKADGYQRGAKLEVIGVQGAQQLVGLFLELEVQLLDEGQGTAVAELEGPGD